MDKLTIRPHDIYNDPRLYDLRMVEELKDEEEVHLLARGLTLREAISRAEDLRIFHEPRTVLDEELGLEVVDGQSILEAIADYTGEYPLEAFARLAFRAHDRIAHEHLDSVLEQVSSDVTKVDDRYLLFWDSNGDDEEYIFIIDTVTMEQTKFTKFADGAWV